VAEDHPGLHFDVDGPIVAERWSPPEAATPSGLIQLRAWYPGTEDAEQLAARVASGSGSDCSVSWQRIPNQDWNEAWKSEWTATALSPRVLIVPSWEEPPEHSEEVTVLRMDPGMAFGTGTHPTTSACATLLDRLAAAGRARSLLDVGTGTGVLAIAGLLLGTQRAVGVDTDRSAVEVAAENAAANGVGEALELHHGGISEAPAGEYEVVVANLLAPLLVELASPLVERVAEGGSLLTGGILVQQEVEVVDALAEAGAQVVERIEGPEWLALRLERQ